MIRIIEILTGKNAFYGTLFFVAVILAFLAPKAAVNVDEQLHYPHAKSVVNWYFTGGEDTSCLETPVTNLKYYGQSIDNFTALFNRIFEIEDEFLVRHFTGALLFWLLLLFSGLVTFQISKSYWISIVTVLSMLFMPRLFGHAFGNLKDIPFAAGYMAGIYMSIRFFKQLPKPSWLTAIYLGLAIAFTCSVRIGGLILFAYLALFLALYFILKPFDLKQILSTKPSFVRLLGQLTVIVLIGYFAGLLFWPYALQNVFLNPVESLGVMEHYKVSIRQIFNGEQLWSTELPWYYLPKWLIISAPEFAIIGFLSFLIFFLRPFLLLKLKISKQFFFEGFLFFAFLFPTLYVVAIDSNLYSGSRQMIFILPLLAIMVAVGIQKLLQLNFNKKIKYAFGFTFLLLMLFPLKHQAETFPANYIYFNSIVGGNKNAWSNYEYDYYFQGLKEPAAYLNHLVENEEDVLVAMNCNLSNYFENAKNISYQYVRYLERSSKDWDYALFGVNYIHSFLLKQNTWQSGETIKTFYHKGNPIAVLLKRNDKKDFKGIVEIEAGNYEIGEKYLKEALINDTNNVWLYVNLAKMSLLENIDNDFNFYLKEGRKIHPTFEPFYLLEAQKLYNEENYLESLSKLDKLASINQRYKPANDLYKAVKDKLNIQ